MSGLFGSSAPAAPAPQPAPTIDQAAQSQDTTDMLRKRRGAASTILAGQGASPIGATSALSSKLVLGQ